MHKNHTHITPFANEIIYSVTCFMVFCGDIPTNPKSPFAFRAKGDLSEYLHNAAV
ncbi:hypothetical protein HMPREF0742_02481 [Rothia aeria F0184]|uniref:Uncharacterized protein n=1 Tax=Rothia aeria F0184 TaxID=888019 RepID=U7UXD7_9MICC|nr:hypothetical protein HMPREF0742_02481 [Rothia aeria F0184]